MLFIVICMRNLLDNALSIPARSIQKKNDLSVWCTVEEWRGLWTSAVSA